MMKFIKNTAKFPNKSFDKAIFFIGPTSMGKSTLLNYIAGKTLIIKKINCIPTLQTKQQSISPIGLGESSTTLFPTIWNPNSNILKGAVIIDCAGDFDTLGAIGEIINSIIKVQIAKQVNHLKIVMVVGESNIGQGGAYGKIFHEGMQQLAQFLGNLSHFSDNTALIVGLAEREEDNIDTVTSLLGNMKKKLLKSEYYSMVKTILEKECYAIFCKQLHGSKDGDVYTPPNHMKDQREKIIKVINSLQFKDISSSKIFNDSTSDKVKQQMTKAMNIVVEKASRVLKKAIQNPLCERDPRFHGNDISEVMNDNFFIFCQLHLDSEPRNNIPPITQSHIFLLHCRRHHLVRNITLAFYLRDIYPLYALV